MTSKKHERLAVRLTDIIIRLNNGERLNIHDLADEHKVSVRTIQRDLNERLALFDYAEAGSSHYQLNKNKQGHLSQAEIRRIANFASIQDLFPEVDRRFFQEKLSQSITVKGFQYENIRHKQREFDRITKAIDENRYIEFDYQKVRGKKTETQLKHHKLQPYHLLNKNGIWYVVGLKEQQQRIYCFTQMNNIQLSEETFVCDPEIKEEILATDSLFFGNRISEIVLQVNAKVAGYFQRRDLLPNQELVRHLDNGDLLLVCKNIHPREITPIVQYWIPHIRVISPVEVQQKMEEGLREYLGLI
ncbi:helix-turn-helix transcriptional regulator [Psychrobacter sp. I-STPA6b]|uniref:helix-turn-helix transcriptional regulator n=1 Tax=Psychrobacter sp. I-STPA6b TaxID=2585718 RepID=UPI001D0C1BC4|nr:WYL domain-containing protein [Psychrobacter sp. I-STPA6b]